MKGTKVLTLSAVGMITVGTQMHVQMEDIQIYIRICIYIYIYIYICSTLRRRIKGAASTINAII